MKIGFTGTQEGMSGWQKEQLRGMLSREDEFHHGDCVGADAEAHAIAREVGCRIVGHPPTNPKKRAFCQCDELRPEQDYLVRNRNIVNETRKLIGAPRGPEVLRSGTWSTIRYAKRVGRVVDVLEREKKGTVPTA